MIKNFSFVYRNPGHWDVYSDKERVFRIRGGGPESWDDKDVQVVGENSMRESCPNWLPFKTITAATAWITDQLMHEPREWPKETANE